MQARSQSFPAAGIPFEASAQDTLQAFSCMGYERGSSLVETVGLAHDAGNLLASLGLYTELLAAPGVLAPRHQHYATELRLIAERSSTLIQRLLARFSAQAREGVEAGERLQPPSSAVDSGARLPEANAARSSHALTLRNLAPILEQIAAGVAKVSVTCSALLPPLDLSTEVLERITVNLVRNATEAIRSGRQAVLAGETGLRGQILVHLEEEAGKARLTVEDSGPGMQEEMIAAYLRPGSLPHGATHGLGHRIVHELVAESGGRLAIRVRPGYGTLFCIRWTIPSIAAKRQPGRNELDGWNTTSISSAMIA
ncbi:MAG: sensor histidine kinase [Acidobacteriaceae bacterium]